MPTIRSMLSGTTAMYRSSYANGTLFSKSGSLFGSTQSNNRTQNSIASLWNSYGSYQSNATSALSGLSMINSNVSSLISSYDSTKTTFYNEFDDTMDDLSKSAANIKNYNFNVGENAITTNESVGEDGKPITTTTYNQQLTDAIKAVTDFAKDYNNSIKFFADNTDVSKRVGRMQTVFADTTYRRANYESIGLNIGSDGKISVDEEKLAQSIANNPNRVSSVLGRDGLAGKAESHISTANSQRDRLFPSAQSMIGADLASASLYTGNAYRNMSSYASVGNLINLMF